MSLIKPQDIARIAEAFAAISDTFLTQQVQVIKVQERTERFMEDSQGNEVAYTLRGLIIDSDATSAQAIATTAGRLDKAEKTVLLDWNDLVELGLASQEGSGITPDRDFVSINGEKWEIALVQDIPVLVSLRSYAKVVVRKKIEKL